MISPIFIGFVLLDALALWALVYGRGRWQVKLAAILVVLAFNFVAINALGSYRGWATTDAPPKDALFISGVVNEPEPGSGQQGSIYLWLVPLRRGHGVLSYNPAADEPRAYRLPYSEGLYKAVVAAQGIQKHGQPAVLHSGKGKRGKGHGHGNALQSGFRAYRLPPPKLPTK